MMASVSPLSKNARQVPERRWRLFDAEGKVLGRMATEIATALRGKDQPSFRPHEDRGDIVVVINTDRVRVTGGKAEKKVYRWHSWYPHGLKEKTFAQMMEQDSRAVVRLAVYGMLPKNRLRDRMITRLKLYPSAEHPHGSTLLSKTSHDRHAP